MPPIVSPPVLPDLVPGELSQLRPRAVLEGLSFDDVTFENEELTDAVVTECALTRVSIVDGTLRGIRISESEIVSLNAPVLSAALSQWRDVSVRDSRLGSAEMFESKWHGVTLAGSKLGYLNLRGAELVNVIIEGCTVDELDLGGVTATRVIVRDCTIGTLDVTRARLKDVDLRATRFETITGLEGLRGATLDETQLAELSWHLASAAGITVE